MNEAGAKQQIVDKIKSNSNILVTVSTDPSVDELSAALGLTVLLNKMGKHTTAVFSGQIPAAMKFLDPEKTFENTVDSLRDFIIALDKEKADHLRYKVEGEVVKIFITPYRTTITSDDLEFTQGDYNVELVLALGVTKRDNLDTALTAHGRILHDATVTTLSVGDMKSELGSINWREQHASSLSEMLVSVTDSLKDDKAELDEQIATAFLTGIVAATNRFSNKKTSSKVMTTAAKLMAAGANQQLIASKLEAAAEIGDRAPKQKQQNQSKKPGDDGFTDLAEGESSKLEHGGRNRKRSGKKPKKDDGSLTISHDEPKKDDTKNSDDDNQTPPATPTDTPDQPTSDDDDGQSSPKPEGGETPLRPDALDRSTEEVTQQRQTEAAEYAEENLAKELSNTLPSPAVVPTISVADLQNDVAQASAGVDAAAEQKAEPVQDEPAPPEAPASVQSIPQPAPQPAPVAQPQPAPAPAAPEASQLSGAVGPEAWQDNRGPSVGGTLNATTQQAADDKRREEQQSRNRTILSHSNNEYVGDRTPMTDQSPINAAGIPSDEPAIPDPFAQLQPPAEQSSAPTGRSAPVQPLSDNSTLADLDQQHREEPSSEDARAAVNAALGTPAAPTDLQQPSPFEAAQPAADQTAGFEAPPLPPLPDFATLPPLPPLPEAAADNNPNLPPVGEPERLEDMFTPAPAEEIAPPQPVEPGQFKIPGQP